MAPRRDQLFVSTGSGLLQRINWNGLLEGEMTMSVHSIPFTNDLENARGNLEVPVINNPDTNTITLNVTHMNFTSRLTRSSAPLKISLTH